LRRVFVDTSAFVALRNAAEREHEAARQALSALVAERAALFTSNYVFSETHTALLLRVSRREAIEWGRMFRAGRAIELVRIDEDVEDDAWAILEQHSDKRWSHVDATSFALMAREGVTEAFSLDTNFAQRGLRVLPMPM
jgi:predicted nucleic acid-binding protein